MVVYIETRMNKSSTNNMKENIMRVPDDHRNKNLSEERKMLFLRQLTFFERKPGI
jgi:hypothetical protein